MSAGQGPYLCTDLCTRRHGTGCEGGDGPRRRRRPGGGRAGQRQHGRRPETPETYVALLITQRSQVQILPPLPSPEAGSEQGSGLLLAVLRPEATGERAAIQLLSFHRGN
jgi:hypothetical protein